MSEESMTQSLFPDLIEQEVKTIKPNSTHLKKDENKDNLPEKLGKAIKLPVPDFSDPNRPLTCLEVDFRQWA